jgi:nitrous oxide reductase accessory protein NosL
VHRTALAVLALPALLAGCADGQKAAVEQATMDFSAALRTSDGGRACSMLAPLTRQELESSHEQPCPEAITSADLLTPSDLRAVDRFGRQAQVVVEEANGRSETWFLSRFDDRWLIVAAGCEPRSGQLPHDCDVEGA